MVSSRLCFSSMCPNPRLQDCCTVRASMAVTIPPRASPLREHGTRVRLQEVGMAQVAGRREEVLRAIGRLRSGSAGSGRDLAAALGDLGAALERGQTPASVLGGGHGELLTGIASVSHDPWSEGGPAVAAARLAGER